MIEVVPKVNLMHKTQFGLKVRYDDIDFGDCLGKGKFGVVFAATYRGVEVAVKVMELRQERQDLELWNFNKEISILEALEHPNIVTFYGAVQDVRYSCILTERCEGSVLDLIKLAEAKKFAITWKLLVAIAKDCAKACEYLHGVKPIIIHRDLKAENLLLDKDFRCRVSDFGLSRILEAAENGAYTLCGTPRWIAPEVYRGEVYTEKIDVYSYGVVLWELFCFSKPYDFVDLINLPYLIACEHVRPGRQLHIPHDLWTLMETCWDPSPHERPSFYEIVAKIEAIQQNLELDFGLQLNLEYEAARDLHLSPPTRKSSIPVNMPSVIAKLQSMRPPAMTPNGSNSLTKSQSEQRLSSVSNARHKK